MKESILFKWTSDDGSSVTIDGKVMTAFDANGQELSRQSDEAQDLFMEVSIILEETMMLSHPKDITADDFRWELRDSMRHHFGPVHMFEYPCHMFHPGPMPMFRNEPDFKNLTEEEIVYKLRKREMEHFKEERRIEREREAKRQQQIIETAIPYEVETEICPDELITENNEHYLKENGTTIIAVGHDKNNANLYNIINDEHRFLLKKHQQRLERIKKNRFFMCDENKVRSYFDADTEKMLFQTEPGIEFHNINIIGAIEFGDAEHNYIYDTDGNLLATLSKDYSLRCIIGGRPVVSKDIKDERRNVFNIVMKDGSFMLKEYAKKISMFGCEERFEVIREDGISEIYSTDDFHKVYASEKPRHIDSNFSDERPDKNMFIFYSDEDYACGIVVDVMSGEVITKDKDGNPKDYRNIEYPRFCNDYNWRAELSVKTSRVDKFNPATGKRVTAKKAKK